ncbi:DUF4405 domain-containing protein [Arcobacter sp.]|uniref:DUF4405 domain-containing protein n=1 Tax=Arcobacter sp. TaxID=1872629 RepID=UPI003D0CE295
MNRTLATSLTTTIFLVIGISGIMMFFHFFSNEVKSLHEYLGLVFVGAVFLHVFYNFKAMKNYFTKRVFIGTLLFTVILSGGFILQSSTEKDNPKGKIIQSVLKAPLENSFLILNITNAKEKLEKENLIYVETANIEELAKLNKISPFEIVNILTR